MTKHYSGIDAFVLQNGQRKHYWALVRRRDMWLECDSLIPGPIPIQIGSRLAELAPTCFIFSLKNVSKYRCWQVASLQPFQHFLSVSEIEKRFIAAQIETDHNLALATKLKDSP